MDNTQDKSNASNPIITFEQFQKIPARDIILLFGGIRPMAKKLGLTPSTVQGWHERQQIPEQRWKKVYDAAQPHERNNISLQKDSISKKKDQNHKTKKPITWNMGFSISALFISFLNIGYSAYFLSTSYQHAYKADQTNMLEIQREQKNSLNKIIFLENQSDLHEQKIDVLESAYQDLLDEYEFAQQYEVDQGAELSQLIDMFQTLKAELETMHNTQLLKPANPDTSKDDEQVSAALSTEQLQMIVNKFSEWQAKDMDLQQKVKLITFFLHIQKFKKSLITGNDTHNTLAILQNIETTNHELQRYTQFFQSLSKTQIVSLSTFKNKLIMAQKEYLAAHEGPIEKIDESAWAQIQTRMKPHVNREHTKKTIIDHESIDQHLIDTLSLKSLQSILSLLKSRDNEKLTNWEKEWIFLIEDRLYLENQLNSLENLVLTLLNKKG